MQCCIISLFKLTPDRSTNKEISSLFNLVQLKRRFISYKLLPPEFKIHQQFRSGRRLTHEKHVPLIKIKQNISFG